MQSADLLAVANAATPPAAAPPAGREDADAFARALADEMDAAKASADAAAGAGDGRCGTPGETDAPRGGDVITPERPSRPDRASRPLLQGLLGGLLRADGLGGGSGGFKGLTDTITAGSGAGAKPDPFKAGAVKAQGAFREALDALGAAINEALKDPSASTAAQGQLPAPVQAALDQVLAAAPPGMAERVAAFAGKLTERLSAMLAAQGDAAGTTTAEVSPQADHAKGGDGVLSAVLAGLGDLDQTAMPELPVATDGAKTPASAAAPATTPTTATDAATPTVASAAGGAENVAKTAENAAVGADAAALATPDAATADGSQTLAPQAPATAETRTAAAAATVRGSPETVAMLASTIARKLEGRTTHFDMELHPAEFGRVDVRLRIDAEGRVAAQMAFDNPVAAADLRARADDLRRQLEQAGFQVASEDLSFTDKGAGGFDQNARNAFAAMDAEAGKGTRARAFADGERAARLADDASRLQRRNLTGLDVRV